MAGDRRALARIVTLIENRAPEARQMLFSVFAHSFFNPEERMSAADLVAMFHFYFLGNPEGLVFDVQTEPQLRRDADFGAKAKSERKVRRLVAAWPRDVGGPAGVEGAVGAADDVDKVHGLFLLALLPGGRNLPLTEAEQIAEYAGGRRHRRGFPATSRVTFTPRRRRFASGRCRRRKWPTLSRFC